MSRDRKFDGRVSGENFRLHISIQADGAGHKISASIIIKLNNRLGELYLSAIMPFHRYLSRYFPEQAIVRLGTLSE